MRRCSCERAVLWRYRHSEAKVGRKRLNVASRQRNVDGTVLVRYHRLCVGRRGIVDRIDRHSNAPCGLSPLSVFYDIGERAYAAKVSVGREDGLAARDCDRYVDGVADAV